MGARKAAMVCWMMAACVVGGMWGVARAETGRELAAPVLSLGEVSPEGASAATSNASTEAAPAADKSGYNLFHPTPASQLREFNSDRPDVTESPFTVDAGHYQLEFSFVEYTHDEEHGVRTDGFSVLPGNMRIGLLNNVELDLIGSPYENILVHGRSEGHHFSMRNSGVGDMQLRAKINFWGNDGGMTAGGIIPFVTVPTETGGVSDHHVEGGVIFPLAVQLPAGFDLGTQAEFDCNRTERNDGYGLDFIHTITLGHALFSEKLNGYIEYAGISPVGTHRTYQAYFDTGVTYALMANVQLDAGINVGLSGRANDFTVFSGLSFRY